MNPSGVKTWNDRELANAQYMSSLQMQINNNRLNEQANDSFKRTGIQELGDTTSALDKLATKLQKQLIVIQLLQKHTTPEIARNIVTRLTDPEIEFIIQRPDIIKIPRGVGTFAPEDVVRNQINNAIQEVEGFESEQKVQPAQGSTEKQVVNLEDKQEMVDEINEIRKQLSINVLYRTGENMSEAGYFKELKLLFPNKAGMSNTIQTLRSHLNEAQFIIQNADRIIAGEEPIKKRAEAAELFTPEKKRKVKDAGIAFVAKGEPIIDVLAERELEGQGMQRKIRGRGLVMQTHKKIEGKVEKPKTYVPLGRYVIHKNRLVDGKCDVYGPHGTQLKKIKGFGVSSDTIDTIQKMCNKEKVDISHLSIEDKKILKNIMEVCDVQEKVNFKDVMTESQKNYHKFEVLKGEIVSGNSNPEIVKEFKYRLLKAMQSGHVSQKDGREVLIDLLSFGF